ncbi:MAG: ABC-F type ribosomal protection protein [Oscillospiraceae bacterium]|nr:ABC-F type ribosomal protection protein [Oscillospiraceae bacterium]
MSLISVNHLTFGYEGSYDFVFEDVSLSLDTDWKLGFIGRNGRGKTTFLKLLMGEHRYAGSISASVAFDYFPLTPPDPSVDSLSVVNAVCKEYAYWQLVRELSLLAVEEEVLYRPFETLSHGERTKVLLAALFLNENHFLLIDEPTNHLDAAGRRLLGEYLAGKKGFILVSHDRAFLDRCVDHVLAINRADIQLQRGTFSSWWENKCRQDQLELEQNRRLKGEIRRLDRSARQKADWSAQVEKSKAGAADKGHVGHMAAKMMKRSKAVEVRQAKAVQEKEKLLKNIEKVDSLALQPLWYHTDPLIRMEEVTVFYGEKRAFGPANLAVRRGERIALQGKNGCGKSTLLRLIQGDPLSFTGRLQIPGGIILSTVPQDPSFLQGDLRDFARDNGLDESLFKAILRKLEFSRVQFDKRMEFFSAGQKKKVLLARSLCQRAHLYLWDEPLNYVDLFSRMQIEQLILEYEPTLLFVEHDAAFTEKIATRTIALE